MTGARAILVTPAVPCSSQGHAFERWSRGLRRRCVSGGRCRI